MLEINKEMNEIEEFEKAFTEVDLIINLMPEELKGKIPNGFKNFIKEEKSKEYNPDIKLPINDDTLLPATIIIMGMIYRDFLVSDDEKIELLKKDKKELEDYENKLKQKYSTENLFKNKETMQQKFNTSMVIYKQSIVKKIMNKIRNLFKRK